MWNRSVNLTQMLTGWLTFASPALDLAIRLYVAKVFLWSGLTKIQSWSTTLMLFEYEYSVPVLSPKLAAVLGTGGELILPPLLALGLATRPVAFGLFVFNYIAVISYPDISAGGIKDHFFWGFLLLVPLFHGAGRLSLDHLITRRFASAAS